MYQDKILVCQECGREFVWTSRPVKCMTPSAQTAGSPARYRFSPRKAGRFIAGNVLPK